MIITNNDGCVYLWYGNTLKKGDLVRNFAQIIVYEEQNVYYILKLWKPTFGKPELDIRGPRQFVEWFGSGMRTHCEQTHMLWRHV